MGGGGLSKMMEQSEKIKIEPSTRLFESIFAML